MPRARRDPLSQVRAAKKKAETKLRGVREVNGIGITKIGADYALKVNLEAQPRTPVPTSIDGVPVKTEVVGKIRAQRID